MFSLIVSLIVGVLVALITSRDLGPVWGIVCLAGSAVIVQIVIALVIRKKVGSIQKSLEEIMRDGQAKANRQMAQFERRPPSSLRVAQQQLEKIQEETVRKTLAATEAYKPYYRWNMMLPKQINTMKVQLYFQLRDFKMVDELMPKALLFDSRSLTIKLVRLFKKDDPALDKFYQKKCARLKGEDGAFVACVYAWMKIKQDQIDKAVAALVAAKKLSDNAILLENYERLANGKTKHFSNANFGDLWYSLFLEEPKMKPQRQAPGRMF